MLPGLLLNQDLNMLSRRATRLPFNEGHTEGVQHLLSISRGPNVSVWSPWSPIHAARFGAGASWGFTYVYVCVGKRQKYNGPHYAQEWEFFCVRRDLGIV